MKVEELVEKLRQPAFDLNEAQALMETAAKELEGKHHMIQFLQANNARLLSQVQALSLDLGLREGAYSGEIKNQ
jgi:hypothetical protein